MKFLTLMMVAMFFLVNPAHAHPDHAAGTTSVKLETEIPTRQIRREIDVLDNEIEASEIQAQTAYRQSISAKMLRASGSGNTLAFNAEAYANALTMRSERLMAERSKLLNELAPKKKN